MGGGYIQLSANQDFHPNFLSGNPEISVFNKVYRRYVHFAVESIEQKFQDDVILGQSAIALISPSADLCSAMYLEVVLPYVLDGDGTYVYGVGNALIKSATLEINGTTIDVHQNDWLNIRSELTQPPGKREGYDRLVGNNPTHNFAVAADLSANAIGPFNNRLYIPLQFWFNRNPGLALPLLGLNSGSSLIKLTINFATLAELTLTGAITDTNNVFSCKLYVDYVFLDSDARQYVAAKPHEYYIEQVQNTSAFISQFDTAKSVDLTFDKPVKELIWIFRADDVDDTFNYSSDGTAEITFTATILNNGNSRFQERNESYFRLIQNKQCHTNIPRTRTYIITQNGIINKDNILNYNQYIYTYSFALFPEDIQPSGHCNFTKIRKSQLKLTFTDALITNYTIKIFAVNYNILRLANGTATLIF
jgi:hypothetical protein